ncbi:MAG: polysaccharide biosynthesis tyrosine autokinase, partial [Ignavibacteriales bacterium]|nr:polysaccharide biosynthesis tyrosine autokinase [Ignavibacteriales bacterium]
VVFSGVAAYTFIGPFIYEATAIVQVNSKPTTGEMSFYAIDFSGMSVQRNLMKEIGVLTSRSLAEDVIQRLKANPVITPGGTDTLVILQRSDEDPPHLKFASDETIIEYLQGDVTYEPNVSADIINIYARSTDPKESAILANTVAEAYYENNLNASRKQLRTAREFLERTYEGKKKELDEAEDSLRSYVEQFGIIDEKGESYLATIAGLDAKVRETEIEMQTTKSLIANYQRRINEIKATLPKNVEQTISMDSRRLFDLVTSLEVQKILDQVAKLEVERDNILASNPNALNTPTVKKKLAEINTEIAEQRKKMQQKIGTSESSSQSKIMDKLDLAKELNNKLIDQQIKLQSLEAAHRALLESLQMKETEYKEIPKRNTEYARLQRSKITLEKLFVAVEEKYQSALVAEQSQFGYVDVLQSAIPPMEFIEPNIPKNLGFGLIVGIILGISLAFLINNFDDRIHKPEEIKRAGISVLTVVPVMDEQAHNLRGRIYTPTSAVNGERGTLKRELLIDEGQEVVKDAMINPHLVSAINPYSRIADAYRRLRTSVQYWRQDLQIRTILVTSGAPQEGKSITSSNLATVFAQAQKKVLLVDVDLRRPSIHEIFSLDLEPGLTEVLFGEIDFQSAIRKTFVENLDIMTCGSIPLNPTELISSPAMRRFKEEMLQQYDVVIFDSPPILLFTDAELLVSMVDSVVFVVKSESTQMGNLEHAVDLIEGIKMNFTGVVVNHYVLNRLHRGYYHLHGDYYYQQKYKEYKAPQSTT